MNNLGINNLSTLVEGQDYVSGEVIVKCKPGISSQAMNEIKTSLGATVMETTTTLGIECWSIKGMSVQEAIAQYSQNPLIEYIEPNYTISINTTIPNDPSFNQLWGLDNNGQSGGTPDADIDAPEAWDIQTGNNVLIGVIDTGVDYTHPDLINNIWTNPGEIAGDGIDNDGNGYVDDVHGYDFANNDGDPYDDNGHGTHVSGTIAADGNNGIGVTGVSWNAQIMGIKFLDANGFGDTFGAIQSVEYATLMGVQLTNNSWGGGGYSQGLYDAIAAAGAAGQLFIAAAGNESNNNDSFPAYPASYNLDNIISVAATDHNDQLAGFSNYGATTVDLAAPGVSVYSTMPGGEYGYLSGTSMATPHVSGVASLIWSQFPNLTAEEVKARILSYTDPIPALNGITVSGGRLNAYSALTETAPPPPPPGEIHGSKWHDLDEDGIQDANEPGLANWTMYLDQNQNGQLDSGETSVLTDINGDYAFINLNPGIYTVAEVVPTGWKQTYPGFNGSFETGNLGSWQKTGEASIQTAGFGSSPTDGTYQALLTSGGSAITDNQLETFLGLALGSLDNLGNGNATQGAAIKQTVTVSAGTQLSFDWNFLTNEGTPSFFNDFGFVSITSGTTNTLANTNSSFIFSPTSFNEETGFSTFSYTFTADGTYTIGVGVTDVGDSVVDSGLLVDNFIFTGNTTPIVGSQTVTVGSGQVITDIDFGNKALFGQIQGTKWNDLNGDGFQDANEPGLAGWKIYLDQNQNGELDTGETSTTTDINGNYTFQNLNPGTYFVAEVMRPGWESTYPTPPTTNYQWSDSNQVGGPTFNWIDISGVGTQVFLSDDSATEVSLPFNFSFFGEDKNTVKISSNGFLTFGSNGTDFTNNSIPNTTDPDDFIAPFWDDLNPGAGGSIYYHHDVVENQFIVQYQDVPRFAEGGNLTFEVILDSDGSILYQYDELNGTLNSATIGIENADGSNGVEVAYNSNYLHDDLAIRIAIPTAGHTVNVDFGDAITDIDFGNKKITPTTINGTSGNDIFNIVDSPVIVYALAGNDVVDGSQSAGANQFYGGKGDDTLIGNNYDQLFGEAGNDYLDVSNGLGDNTLYGGKGNDTLLGNVNDQLFGEAGNDTLDVSNGGGNNFLDGGAGEDILLANTNDQLYGGAGNDTLNASNGGGYNLLDGGAGADILTAGGYDQLLGGAGDDILDASNSTGYNTLSGGKGDDNLLASFNDQLNGGDGEDILNASNGGGNNILNGDKGDDVLLGNFNDQLNGGDGDDILNVSNGAGNNILNGGKGDDNLLGSFNDQLNGGAGDDILNGGYGGSTMTGGSGDDFFRIADGFVPFAAHTITDFNFNYEVMGIGGLGISFSNLTIAQVGSDTLISALGVNLATLTGIQASNIDSTNFVFA